MSQRTLEAYVVLGGRVDNTFGTIGSALVSLGGTVGEVSQELMDFGKSSLGVYKDYETNMKEAEGSLATLYGKDTQELEHVMNDLELAAKEWASTTIFHTSDVSHAIAEAAHASWNYEQIMENIPAAMRIAQAGNMDLSQGLDYMITVTKAAGVGLDETSEFIDQWAFAANSSAGTITEFGDAMQRMGSTMQFADSSEELLTLLAVLHNGGTKGAAAGTLLRNSMIRLIAPTKKAQNVMEQLGITQEEVDEAMGESTGNIDAAMDSLEKAGFSAYDSEGNLKGFLEIFTELNTALKGMKDENERNNVLASIFPTRTITGALAFVDAAARGFDGLYAAMEAGDAEGYSQYLSDLMMSGLMGAEETVKSKLENLQLLVGESLAPNVKNLYEWTGGIVDSIAGMDDTKFNSIVSGSQTFATLGGGLSAAGFALMGIGKLLGPGGLIGLGALSLASITSSLNTMREFDFKDQFGDMAMDMPTLNEYVQTLGADFETAYKNVNSFKNALDNSVKSYKDASAAFSSDLLSAMLTKKEFTPEEKAALEQQGIAIYGEVIKSITASHDMAAEFWTALYGGEEAKYDPKYQTLIDILDHGNQGLVAEAEAAAGEMRAAMVNAFTGEFTSEEYDQILEAMKKYNAIIAKAANEAKTEEQFIQQEKLLLKAQTASFDETNELANTYAQQRDTAMAEFEDVFLEEQARARRSGASEDVLAENQTRYDATVLAYDAGNAEFLYTLWNTNVKHSGLGEAYARLGNYADLYLNGMSADVILPLLESEMGKSKYAGDEFFHVKDTTREQLGKFMGFMVSSMGGSEKVWSMAAYHEQNGNAAMAARLRELVAMEQLANGFSDITRTERDDWDFFNWGGDFETTGQLKGYDNYTYDGAYQRNRARYDAYGDTQGYTVDDARTMADFLGEDAWRYFNAAGRGKNGDEIWKAMDEMSGAEQKAVSEIVDNLKEVYDFGKVNADDDALYAQKGNAFFNVYAAWKLMNMSDAEAELYRNQLPFNIYSSLNNGYYGFSAAYPPFGTDNQEQPSFLRNDGQNEIPMKVTYPGVQEDAASTRDTIGKEFTPITQTVTIVTERSELGGTGTLGSMGGGGGMGFMSVALDGMATGGRATKPVVFGEAGPEWFIPERHDRNTANLLLSAMGASGYSLVDLAEMSGASMFADGGSLGSSEIAPTLVWHELESTQDSGDSGGSPSFQVQYSPVIHADNAEGVERALMADKARLKRMLEELMEERELYESVVRY